MTGETDTANEAARHCDTVVGARGYLLQEDLHYGYFGTGAETLVAATDALTNEMLALAKLSEAQKDLDIGCGTGKESRLSNCTRIQLRSYWHFAHRRMYF